VRILFLNHNVAFSGGTFYRALKFGRWLAQNGHDVHLMSISPSRRWRHDVRRVDGLLLEETPDLLWGWARTGWDPWDTIARMASLLGTTWDVIHAWDCRPVVILPALFAHRNTRGSRLFIDWCDWWGRGGTITERSGKISRALLGPVETFFEEAFRTQADVTTVISRALAGRAAKLGVPPRTIHVLPQGCDPPSARLPKEVARAAVGLSNDDQLIGFLGRLSRSDATLLFGATKHLLRRRPQAKLLLMGNHRGAVPSELRANGCVIERGFVPPEKLNLYLAACDVLVAPLADSLASRARWPSKLNVYLSAGVPVVTTKVGDLPELLDAEVAAKVVPPSEEALAAGVERMLDRPEEAASFASRGLALAAGVLSWDAISSRLETLYTQTASRA
jgi:glycosyltransferase involved in cell wall biosynthesis